MSPRGVRFDQALARQWAAGPGLVILCPRFEGVDDRIVAARGLIEVCIGDYVLSGGEIAALAVLDACVRLIPGVMGKVESGEAESFEGGLLEYPQYTRPRDWEGRAIPDVLLSGDHAKIARWRRRRRSASRASAQAGPVGLSGRRRSPRRMVIQRFGDIADPDLRRLGGLREKGGGVGLRGAGEGRRQRLLAPQDRAERGRGRLRQPGAQLGAFQRPIRERKDVAWGERGRARVKRAALGVGGAAVAEREIGLGVAEEGGEAGRIGDAVRVYDPHEICARHFGGAPEAAGDVEAERHVAVGGGGFRLDGVERVLARVEHHDLRDRVGLGEQRAQPQRRERAAAMQEEGADLGGLGPQRRRGSSEPRARRR